MTDRTFEVAFLKLKFVMPFYKISDGLNLNVLVVLPYENVKNGYIIYLYSFKIISIKLCHE